MNQFLKTKVIFLSLALFFIPLSYNACGPSPKALKENTANNSLSPIVPEDLTLPAFEEDQPLQPESQKIAVFMAIGHQGSRMFSCDKGRTWKGYVQYDPEVFPRCTVLGADCDHNAGAGKEIAYGPGGFIFNYGNGQPGQLLKTVNGQKYEVLIENRSFPGITYGQGVYLLGTGRDQLYSKDSGVTWQSNESGKAPTAASNVRGTFFAEYGSGRFFLQFATDGVQDLAYSDNGGLSFKKPEILPLTCGKGDMAYLNQRVLLLSDDLCLSLDGGANWTIVDLPIKGSTLLVNQTHFLMYRPGFVMESVDGVSWTEKPLLLNGMAAANLSISMITFHPSDAVYVGFLSRSVYEKTEYYYSDNGSNWFRVEKEKGLAPLAPHPIKDISAGYLTQCPKD